MQPIPIEFAAMGHRHAGMRTERRAVINRLERQRLEFLEDRVLVIGLDPDEAAELAYLRGLAGTGPPAPPVRIKDGGCCDRSHSARYEARGAISGRQRVLQTLEVRWPRRPRSGRQAVVELYRMRDDWYLTPRQRQLQRMRRST